MSHNQPNNIDELFNKKLHSFESKPKDDAWEKIAFHLPEENVKVSKLKRFHVSSAWVYAAAACLVIGLLATTFFLFQNKNVIDDHISAVNKEKTPLEPSGNHNNSNTTPSNNTLSNAALPSSDKQASDPKTSIENTPDKKTISSDNDKKKTISLPDGSVAILNKQSEIVFDGQNPNERVVHVSGEAFFNVKHLDNKPFIIYANLSKIEVVGTSFIVRSVKKEKFDEVQVTTGKVAFSKLDGKGDIVYLTAGHKGIIRADHAPKKETIKNKNYNAWVSEKIEFDDTSLSEVFTTLEQYYDISVTSANKEILNCRFTGVFERSDINEVLEVLAVQFNLKYNKASKNYSISGEGCQ